MSYVRFGQDGSAVYVFAAQDDSGHTWLECGGCLLHGSSYLASSTTEMITHLAEHSAAGQFVPECVVPELQADDPLNFPIGAGN